MRKLNNSYHYSASDLTLFHDSPFASWLEQLKVLEPDSVPQPDAPAEFDTLLQTLGYQHEAAFFKQLQQQGQHCIDIQAQNSSGDFNEALNLTKQALTTGAEVIFQTALCHASFAGFADFLVKVPGQSALGDYHYEVWDTKLASTSKISFVLQLLCYSEMLGAIQQRLPAYITVVLGSQQQERFETAPYWAYYQKVKAAFLQFSQRVSSAVPVPDPYSSAKYGRWETYAQALLAEQDHLSDIANIRRSQVAKLQQAGISSCDALVKATPNLLKKLGPQYLNLQKQATLQQASIGLPSPLFELKPAAGEYHPLAQLPASDPGDIFFDLEGFPLQEGGLEYLWGYCSYGESTEQLKFDALWAHDPHEEHLALQQFIRWVYQRWQRYPLLHIYHYGHYETTAMKRLAARYTCCETELDELLRHKVFVDLYTIVRQGLFVGEPAYSIKNIEHLYRSQRATTVSSGGDSVVEYQRWRDLVQQGQEHRNWQQSALLTSIRDYNQDDCFSTAGLTHWLRALQQQHGIQPLPQQNIVVPDIPAIIPFTTADIRQRLLERAANTSEPEHTALHTLASVLEFHEREKKPVFWQIFEFAGMTDDELYDEPEVIVGCEIVERAQKYYRLSFPAEQALQLGRHRQYCVVMYGQMWVVSLENHNSAEGTALIKSQQPLPDNFNLIPYPYVNAEVLAESIRQLGAAILRDESTPAALWQFLRREPPRYLAPYAAEPKLASMPLLQRINSACLNLDNSYLVIQGPPGAGKTYTAAHLISNLLLQGKRVAITSNSHKALQNLLAAAKKRCIQHPELQDAGFICVNPSDYLAEELQISVAATNAELVKTAKDFSVIGATVFALTKLPFSPPIFDYLFVDEAGQVALANLIAVAGCAKNLVLLGDQMQLGQPIMAAHPGLAGTSVLEYLSQEQAVLPEALGFLLDTSYRMHPDICQLISEQLYQGRLKADAANINQQIEGFSWQSQAYLSGVHYLPCEHQGNRCSSLEEAGYIKTLYQQLLQVSFVDKTRQRHPLTAQDIMIITPYNLQVQLLKRYLPEARIGTVDKFQGQEAPVVIISMCCSDASDAARGIDFLFDSKRLNVAISRAKILSFIVASPQLLQSRASSLAQMRQLSLFFASCVASDIF